MVKNSWEIENIEDDMSNESKTFLLQKYIFYDNSDLNLVSNFCKIETTNDFICMIENSQLDTEIMISYLETNNILIYICILDSKVFIINYKNLSNYQKYFKDHLNSLIYITDQCKEYFNKNLYVKEHISKQNNHIFNEEKDIFKIISNEIIQCIIKKSQYRTIKKRHEILPDKYRSTNKDYKLSDFIPIRSGGFELYYNTKDQILNVLKFYNDQNRYNHEIEFYKQIENTFPFIRKIFGIINPQNGLPIIILEYVEGETLDKFLLSTKEIDFKTKIKIIEEILFSIYYMHSNGFYSRDLKPWNIIIDSENDAIFIDFDVSKKMNSLIEEEENTGNIGNPFFIAPEQNNSNNYTYKVDSYSIGMIIHFIITRQKYNLCFNDLSKIYARKENISRYYKFPKLAKEYEFILHIYEKCFEISPNSRPSITSLIENFINNIRLKNINKTVLPHIINQLEKYEKNFKISNKYMHDESIERSYLQYFLGYIYYFGKYVSRNINKAIVQLEKASNRNNSNAQYLLGEIYYFNECISRDINKSTYYLTLSANQNNSNSQYLLGGIYYKGEYISRDINKSINYLTLSANQNHSKAQYYLGEIYYKGEYISQDINKSIYYFTLSANQNHSKAQYYLGAIYYLGQYVSRNINKSIYYLTLSANQNNSYAQYFLGVICYSGQYISRDINKSIYYLTLSANQNHSYAQYYLGIIYYLGQYITRDINQSIHYLTLSANQNNSNAQCFLGSIYYKGKYISHDINKSMYYLTISANQNNSDARYLLGEIYYLGQYVSCDINKSIHYLTLSANQYNQHAQYYLGEIYYKGEYISQDINKSIYYFTLSANQNNPYAQYYLGVIYYLGQYVSRDINKSIYYLTLSANQNHSYAQYYLGIIYYLGQYISRDINKSIHYLTLSADQNNSYAQNLLGEIYYNGKYYEKNIKLSIYYFKKSSSFYNSSAKNYLGIIHKNGDGVKKNIYFARIYFKEAIKQKGETYSMYNLARIYYFGIEMERKISKAILLLENASKENLYIADLFLFYIFSNCDDKNFLNNRKSIQYYEKCRKQFLIHILLDDFYEYEYIQKLHSFLRDYDLIHSYDYLFDLIYYFENEKFYDWKMHIDDNVQANNRSLIKDINADFYQGLYI